MPPAGKLAGRTWSPERATVPGKLVALSHALRAYLDAAEDGAERLREELDSYIAAAGGMGGMLSPLVAMTVNAEPARRKHVELPANGTAHASAEAQTGAQL